MSGDPAINRRSSSSSSRLSEYAACAICKRDRMVAILSPSSPDVLGGLEPTLATLPAVLMPVGSAMCYFLPFLAASRLTLYAIATACFTGLPAFTSALMFLRNAALLVDLLSGMVISFCRLALVGTRLLCEQLATV